MKASQPQKPGWARHTKTNIYSGLISSDDLESWHRNSGSHAAYIIIINIITLINIIDRVIMKSGNIKGDGLK